MSTTTSSVVKPNAGTSQVTASPVTNVLIKKALPPRGLVSSYRKRMERLITTLRENSMLQGDVRFHTNAGWGVVIWTATVLLLEGNNNQAVEFFFAVVPIGSTGSGFAFFEMYAAGAQAILRWGAGSDRKRHAASERELVVVEEATNMVNSDVQRTDILKASGALTALIKEQARQKDMPTHPMICLNVDDYHGYNFTELFDQGEAMRERIHACEQANNPNHLDCCWDMETAALYWRAQQFGRHAATILVPHTQTPALEQECYKVLLESLASYKTDTTVEAAATSNDTASGGGHHRRSLTRTSRQLTSYDRIGVEDALYLADCDVETGNGMFAD